MIVVITAVLIIGLLGMVAFAVDVAYMHLTRAKLRTSVDAAARAAGEALSRTQDLDEARAAARNLAAANEVAGEPLELADEDIVPGRVAFNTTGAWTFSPGGSPVNALRVIGRRTDGSLSGPVPLFFARALGVDDFQPVQSATVVRLDRDICVVVDRSSSMKLYLTDTAPSMSTSDWRFCRAPNMSLSRWGALVQALDEFVTALDETPQTEHVALVSYASSYSSCGYTNHTTDINRTLTGDSDEVMEAIYALSATPFNGNTNIGAGMNTGRSVLHSASARPFAAKTLVLMTDGHRTEGPNPVSVAADAFEEGITVHTITFGDGANQSEMRQAAIAGGGKYWHAPDADTLRSVFREVAYTLPVVITE